MADSTRTTEAQIQPRPLYEASDVDSRRITFFGIGLAALVLMVMTLTYVLYGYVTEHYIGRQTRPSSLAYTRAPTPEPRLTVNAPAELRQLRAMEDSALNGYAWVDKESGIVRIPIERAMEVLAKKGLPTRQSATAPPPNQRKNLAETRPKLEARNPKQIPMDKK